MGPTFVTAEKMEAVIQNLERRSFAKIPLEDGRAMYVNPVQVVCVRES